MSYLAQLLDFGIITSTQYNSAKPNFERSALSTFYVYNLVRSGEITVDEALTMTREVFKRSALSHFYACDLVQSGKMRYDDAIRIPKDSFESSPRSTFDVYNTIKKGAQDISEGCCA